MDKDNLPPGFRFHPTDEELISYYLHRKLSDVGFSPYAIADVNFNKSEPWDLPDKAKIGEKEWYFFSLRDRKYPTGLRTNRATDSGYWKTTGKDKEIFHCGTRVGMKKTLVFYKGRAPKGEKTNWIMHEYRHQTKIAYKPTKEEWVVCRIFRKRSSCKKPPPSPAASSQSIPSLMDSPCRTNTVGDFSAIHEEFPVLNNQPTTPTSLNSASTSHSNYNNTTSYNNIISRRNNDMNNNVNIIDTKMSMNMHKNWSTVGRDAAANDQHQQQDSYSWSDSFLESNLLPNSEILMGGVMQFDSYPRREAFVDATACTSIVDDAKLNFPSSSSNCVDSAQQQPFGESMWSNY